MALLPAPVAHPGTHDRGTDPQASTRVALIESLTLATRVRPVPHPGMARGRAPIWQADEVRGRRGHPAKRSLRKTDAA